MMSKIWSQVVFFRYYEFQNLVSRIKINEFQKVISKSHKINISYGK